MSYAVKYAVFSILGLTLILGASATCAETSVFETARDYDARKATVFLFVDTDCPIANQYAPKLERIAKTYAGKGVYFLRVYSGDYYDDEDISEHAKTYKYSIPALMDKEYLLAIETGARITPEAAVVDENGDVRYCGRIDNRYKGFGEYRREATQEDLTDAIDAVLEGREVEVKTAKAIGCFMNVPEQPEEDEEKE